MHVPATASQLAAAQLTGYCRMTAAAQLFDSSARKPPLQYLAMFTAVKYTQDARLLVRVIFSSRV